MPYSDYEHKELTKEWYKELLPNTVVDIGAGAGIYAELFRPEHRAHWTAIDIFAPNEKRFNLNDKYDKVIISDVRYIDPQYLQADLIIAGDVIEHLHYEDVEPVITKLLANTKHLLISLPIIHYEQGEFEGNTYETHHYHWKYDELLELLNRIGKVMKSENGKILGVYLAKGKL